MRKMMDPSEGYDERFGYADGRFIRRTGYYHFFRSEFLSRDELSKAAKPTLREHFIVLDLPYPTLLSRHGGPPIVGQVMVPLFVKEVRDWCRQSLSGPVEIVEFFVEVPTPDSMRIRREVPNSRFGAFVIPAINTETIVTRGYAVEFASAADMILFALRWK
jgi:hypothetical protein